MSSAVHDKPELSVLMPALNEEKNIRDAISNSLKAFDKFGINGEVIVINDGSTDSTEKIIAEVMSAENRVRTLKHDTPQGIGSSFWDGVDHTEADYVVMLPGDNENDPWEIFRYYKLLEHVDMVIPFVYNKEVRSLFRNIVSYLYRFIINSTFLVNYNYTNGTVLFRRSVLQDLGYRSDGFFFHTDILVRAAKRGYLFAEVPYRLNLRHEGVSKAVTFPSLANVIKGYVKLVRDLYFNKKITRKGGYTEGSRTLSRYENDSETTRAKGAR